MNGQSDSGVHAGEKFRVFRLDEELRPAKYVGTYAAPNAKEAVRKAVWDDERGGRFKYEAHVVRNASVHDVLSRDERFIDSIKQLNTSLELGGAQPNS